MLPTDIARWQGSVDSWLAQGSVAGLETNAPTNTVIADSGQLAAGWYDFTVILAGDGDHYYANIEHRNSPNTAVLHRWVGVWKANIHNIIVINNWKMVIEERLRVVVKFVSNDKLLATIHWVRRI